MIKILAEKRGALQGVTVKDILRQAFGPDVEFLPHTEAGYVGAVVRRRAGDVAAYDILDMVLELHDAAVA